MFEGIADSIKAGMTSFKHFMAYKGALMVNDDELFASGYLRGHLTLAVADLEHGEDHSPEALNTAVSGSLEKAIQAGELSPRDQSLVLGMWDNLFQQAKR